MATVVRSETHPGIESYEEVNRDILKILSRPGKGYFVLLAIILAVLGLGIFAWLLQIVLGIGMAGLRNPVGWGAYITTFVFWVGIAHSGTLISAILYLFRGRSLPDHPPRPALDLLLPAAVPEPARAVAQLPLAADLGRVRGQHLPDRERHVLLSGDDPGHRRGA